MHNIRVFDRPADRRGDRPHRQGRERVQPVQLRPEGVGLGKGGGLWAGSEVRVRLEKIVRVARMSARHNAAGRWPDSRRNAAENVLRPLPGLHFQQRPFDRLFAAGRALQALLRFLRRDLGEEGPANLAVQSDRLAPTGVKLPLAPVCGLSQLTPAPSLWGSSAVASAATARRLSSASRPRASSGEGLRIEPVTSEASATKLLATRARRHGDRTGVLRGQPASNAATQPRGARRRLRKHARGAMSRCGIDAKFTFNQPNAPSTRAT